MERGIWISMSEGGLVWQGSGLLPSSSTWEAKSCVQPGEIAHSDDFHDPS